MTTRVIEGEDGGIYLPKRLGWGALIGGTGILITVLGMWYDTRATFSTEILMLQRNDIESKARGDSMRQDITELKRDRDRITRVEEQLKVLTEMIREIREDLRKR